MRKFLVLVSVLVSACTSPLLEETSSEARGGSFDVEVGQACSAEDAPLCDSGFGICKASVCRAQCFAVGRIDRCPAGQRVQIDYERAVVDGEMQVISQICYCLPE